MGFFEKLVAGLGKTREIFFTGWESILKGFSGINDDF